MMPDKLHELSDLAQMIDYEFGRFDDYLNVSSLGFDGQIAQVAKVLENIRTAKDKLVSDAGPNLHDSGAFGKWEDLNTDEYMYGLQLVALQDMKKIFLHSSFTFAASIFEGFLKRVCEIFSDGRKIGPQHLIGSSFTLKAQLFLEKVVGVELPQSAEWKEFRKFVDIRNSIVHDNSVVARKVGKPFEAQSEKYKAIYGFKDFFVLSEHDSSVGFTIESILFIEKFAEEGRRILSDILNRCIAFEKNP